MMAIEADEGGSPTISTTERSPRLAMGSRGRSKSIFIARCTTACMARASCQRSPRSKARARSTMAATTSGASAHPSRSEGAGCVAVAMMSSALVLDPCTCRPERHAKITAPIAQMSVRASTNSQRARACSGDMKAGLPSDVPRRVVWPVPAGPSCSRAMPKSRIFTSPEVVRKMFAGLTSRWTICLSWAAASASSTASATRRTSRRARLAVVALPALAQGLALEQLHHEEDEIPVVLVVEDGDDARVLHLVGDVALAQEPRADRLVARELRVQELDGDPLAVAVARRPDRGHAPGPDLGLEAPLPLQGPAHEGGRAQIFVAGHGSRRRPVSRTPTREGQQEHRVMPAGSPRGARHALGPPSAASSRASASGGREEGTAKAARAGPPKITLACYVATTNAPAPELSLRSRVRRRGHVRGDLRAPVGQAEDAPGLEDPEVPVQWSHERRKRASSSSEGRP